ncbi:SWAP/Surp superfamily, partial [Arabidopsis thaliana x Arabidopsis arenosa]
MSITEQPPDLETIGWIEKMAYLVALKGPEFEKEMMI